MTLVKCTPGSITSSRNAMWSPFDSEFFRMGGFTAGVPGVNISETGTGFTLELAAPGFNKENFSVVIEKDVLVVSAKFEKQSETQETTWARREWSVSSFERRFKLPATVASENIAARYENGVLFVNLPKREEAKEKPAREITIG